MRPKTAIFVAALLAGCTAPNSAPSPDQWRTYEQVSADELRSDTLFPGDQVRLEYKNGESVEFVVREVRKDEIVSATGDTFEKTGVESLEIKSAQFSARPHELSHEDLRRGQSIQIEYSDGRTADIIVSEVKENTIVAEDGRQWPKAGIERLTVKYNGGETNSYIGNSIFEVLDALTCLFTAPNCGP